MIGIRPRNTQTALAQHLVNVIAHGHTWGPEGSVRPREEDRELRAEPEMEFVDLEDVVQHKRGLWAGRASQRAELRRGARMG